MTKNRARQIAALIVLLFLIYIVINKRIGISVPLFDENHTEFTLKPGDILVRPNLNWLPGSSKVASGRNFGHVAIVVKGAEGITMDETLQKALVVEAVIFDQLTRTFIFDSKKQVRKVPASISFGKRFNGIRYRLRINLTKQQQNSFSMFLEPQVGISAYNLFSLKKKPGIQNSGVREIQKTKENWNCATLAWFSVLLIANIDIDNNKGFLVYPNDLIRSSYFKTTEGLIRF